MNISASALRQASPPPGFVTAKMQALSAHSDQMLALAAAPIRSIENQRRTLDAAKQHLQRLHERSHAYPQLYDEADDAGEDIDERLEKLRSEIVRADADVQRIEAEIEAALALHRERDKLHELAAHSVNICRDWLQRLTPGATLTQAPAVAISDLDLRSALEKTRSDIAELQGKVRTLEQAPQPFEDVEARIQQWVAEQAGSQRLAVRAARGEAMTVNLFTPTGPLVPQRPEVLAMLAKIAPKALTAVLLEAAAADIPKAEPLSTATLEKRASALAKQLEQLERSEEAIVVALLDRGDITNTSRRREARPAIILGVAT